MGAILAEILTLEGAMTAGSFFAPVPRLT